MTSSGGALGDDNDDEVVTVVGGGVGGIMVDLFIAAIGVRGGLMLRGVCMLLADIVALPEALLIRASDFGTVSAFSSSFSADVFWTCLRSGDLNGFESVDVAWSIRRRLAAWYDIFQSGKRLNS